VDLFDVAVPNACLGHVEFLCGQHLRSLRNAIFAGTQNVAVDRLLVKHFWIIVGDIEIRCDPSGGMSLPQQIEDIPAELKLLTIGSTFVCGHCGTVQAPT